jgi:hypothetical protein
MIKINKDILKELKPCEGRYKNYLQHYSEFDGEIIEFLSLDKIEYSDKIWVAKRLISKEISISWAVKCAESVLPIFKRKYPNDNRVENCINAAKNKKSINEILEARKECRDAAADAAYTAATAATDAAYDAATADAAYDAAYAADAAAYAAAYAAYAACTADAAATDAARKMQQQKNIEFLIAAIKEGESV